MEAALKQKDFLDLTGDIRENYVRFSSLMTEFRTELLELHPDFEKRHWMERLFFRKFSPSLKKKELELLTIMIQQKLYFEFLDYMHVYKNPIWFMTMSLTLFASHKLWFLFFLFFLFVQILVIKLREKEKNENIMKVQTKMDDVKGIDDFKEEFLDIINFLMNPEPFLEIGAKLPKGLLLEGPPGVGKTLIAKAIAGESKCDFKYISGSELEGFGKGQSENHIKGIFEELRKNDKPTIIFIDEFDSIGAKRMSSMNIAGTNLLNQLLTEMDGFQKKDKIIVIASTNFAQKLDPAIMRPGRFDKIVNIPLPALEGRQEILKFYIQKTKSELKSEEDFRNLARRTGQMTGSDLKNFVNIASINAIKEGREISTKIDFDMALDRMHLGVTNKTMEQTKEE